MKLYQFTLPTNTNRGDSYEKQRKLWEAKAMQLASRLAARGFASRGFAEGSWQGEDRVYRETVAIYEVACEKPAAQALLDEAFDLFTDQLAIFYAELGTARIVDRPAYEGA